MILNWYSSNSILDTPFLKHFLTFLCFLGLFAHLSRPAASFAEIQVTETQITEKQVAEKQVTEYLYVLGIPELETLAASPGWRHLLHYQPRAVSGQLRSLVDDPAFFLAPNGKTDPVAELKANIAALAKQEQTSTETEIYSCRFPARAAWLQRALNASTSTVQSFSCPRFNEWREALGGVGVTIIFPAAYLNNPASMFGHTLIRIEAEGQSVDSQLLAYGANYAAATAETNGLLFAAKGIFGGYRGTFSIAPYYKLVSKYSDLESRDIWEYRLALSETEREQLLRHLWELGATYFDYFFFDENCSYHLLGLLEVARDDLDLSTQFSLSAIPSETVRSLVSVPGLVSSISYRPSKSAQLRTRVSELSPDQQRLAYNLGSGTEAVEKVRSLEVNEIEKARILELAYEYLDYQRLRGGRKSDLDFKKELALTILKERSALPQLVAPTVPTPTTRPDQGHLPARLAFALKNKNSDLGANFSLRPAYHDFTDSDEGFVRGSELVFFDSEYSWSEHSGVKLERFTPLRIRSLSARDDFIRPLSWQVGVEVARARTSHVEDSHLVLSSNVGFGYAWEIFSPHSLFAVMGGVKGKQSRYFPDNGSLGSGLEALWNIDLNPEVRVVNSYSLYRFGINDQFSESELAATLRYSLSYNSSMAGSFSSRNSFGASDESLTLQFAQHF